MQSDLNDELASFDTATLGEAGGLAVAALSGIHSLVPGMRVAGPALTVACPAGDNLMIHVAVSCGNPGDILVVQCHDPSFGTWGEILTEAALAKGIRALVIDGSVRDIDGIRRLGFPIFARGTALRGASKKAKGILGSPISCGGSLVWPGDFIVADDSGIVIIPKDNVQQVLTSASNRRQTEERLIEQLRKGLTTLDLLDLRQAIADIEPSVPAR